MMNVSIAGGEASPAHFIDYSLTLPSFIDWLTVYSPTISCVIEKVDVVNQVK